MRRRRSRGGGWTRVVGLDDVRVDIASVQTPDGHSRLRGHGGELVGEVAQFEDVYRLCYLRGPGGIIVALAEEVG